MALDRIYTSVHISYIQGKLTTLWVNQFCSRVSQSLQSFHPLLYIHHLILLAPEVYHRFVGNL